MKVGSRIVIPRDKFIQWLDAVGVECYKNMVEEADKEYEMKNQGNFAFEVITVEIRMFDVGFGDCFLFTHQEQAMMVDCGSISLKDNLFNSIVNDIKKNYLDPMIYRVGLITHFHEDHYKGYKYIALNNKGFFDALYLPYLYIEDKSSKRPVILEWAIYCYALLNKTAGSFKISHNILNHAGMALDLVKYANIRCLSSFNLFSFGGRYFQVLWPDKTIEFDQKMIDYLETLDEIFSNNRKFNEIKRLILENFKEWYENTTQDGLVDSETSRLKVDHLTSIVNRQTVLLEQLDEIKEELYLGLEDSFFRSFKNYGTRLFSKGNNATSLVFHDKFYNLATPEVAATSEVVNLDSRNILMTGDITKGILEKYLYERFVEPYYIVKSPHHGTRSHYSYFLPSSISKILISTGPRYPYGKVCLEYKSHKDALAERICTSGCSYCEIVDSGSSCYSCSCNNMQFIDVI